MNYKEAIAYILEIPKFTKKNSLTHTRDFLKCLGNPERGKKIIHVAGTNGKGSVCAYTQSLLLAEKKEVGFFTSPHLVKMNERIRINGVNVSDEAFLESFHETYNVVQKMTEAGKNHPTFFEFLFGMAMLLFDKKQVEYVILETGLGGRLDATNAIEKPFLTIITSISLDHTEILGETIEEIAAEKAGIIKPHVPVIFDGHEKRSAKVIRKRAEELQVPCREITKNAYEIQEITSKDIAFSNTNAYYENSIWKLDTSACYQVQNAMLALEAMQYIAGTEEKHLKLWEESLYQVHWEGRMEEVLSGVVVDGAHNLGAIEAFAESVNSRRKVPDKTVILFSAVKEKDYRKMIECLCKRVKADTYILTTVKSERGIATEELARVFREYTDVTIIEKTSPAEAFDTALKEKGENGQVYCLGSLYLVGEIKEIIAGGKEYA